MYMYTYTVVLSPSHNLTLPLTLPQDNIPESTLKKLKKYIDNPKFLPEIVEKTSKVHVGLHTLVETTYSMFEATPLSYRLASPCACGSVP